MPCNRSSIRRFIGGREKSEDLEKGRGSKPAMRGVTGRIKGAPRTQKERERELEQKEQAGHFIRHTQVMS